MPNIFKILHSACCGIDVHKKTSVIVCLLKMNERGEYADTIRTFSTMTADLEILKAWLREEGCKKIAIESAGVYWIPVFNVLERDFEVILANTPQDKDLPGRKNNAGDLYRTAKLLALRLINGNFIPAKDLRELRELTRYRDKLTSIHASEKDRVYSILENYNLKFGPEAMDIFSVFESVVTSISAEKAENSGPDEIVELANEKPCYRISGLAKALQGRVEPHHAEILPLLFEYLFFLEDQIARLEKRIKEKAKPYQQELDLLNTGADTQ
jgi:transposase